MVKPRLTSKHIPGKGDLGYSYVLANNPPLLKSSPACKIQGEIEGLRNSIEDLLCTSHLLQGDLVYLLSWLNRNVFSLASFCYLKADTETHILPESLLDFLNSKTKELKKLLGDCPDFMSQSHLTLIKLDGVRIKVRSLEQRYTSWRYSSEVTETLMSNTDLIPTVNFHAAILNRLSAYLFEATRYESSLLRENGEVIEARYWQATVEEFNIPTEIIFKEAA